MIFPGRGFRRFARLNAPFPLIGFPFFFPFAMRRRLRQEIVVSEGPTFVADLMGEKAAAAGIRGADLGIPLMDGTNMWLVFGDTKAVPPARDGAGSVLESPVPFDPQSASWKSSKEGFYSPLRSARAEGSDVSTVPTGAIAIGGTRYIFAMQVEHWGKGAEPTRAHGVLLRQDGEGFSEAARWKTDGLHVNTAPLLSKLPDGTDAVFMYVTGRYRASPIYLAYALPSNIEDPGKYCYFTSYGEDGLPVWSGSPEDAAPLPDFADVGAGELSFIYHPFFKSYLLMFKDYLRKVFVLYCSDSPYGPFSGMVGFIPCGSPKSRPEWMKPGWGGCYGGFMLPGKSGPDGHDLYFTLSLRKPYTTVLMKMRLGNPPAEPGSTTEG